MTIREFLTNLANLAREYDYPLKVKANNKIQGNNIHLNLLTCLSQIDQLVENTPHTITSKAENIPDERFIDCSTLETAYFTRVQSIGNAAFRLCTNLTDVRMPETSSVGNNAFYGCTSLQTVNLPKATTIGTNAFRNCDGLTIVNLDSVTDIGTYAFNGCANLISIHIGARHPNVCRLANANAFVGTPIADGTGYIYVPRNLVNSYKSASGWSTYANQIRAM